MQNLILEEAKQRKAEIKKHWPELFGELGITVPDIASTAGVSEATVRRVVTDLMTDQGSLPVMATVELGGGTKTKYSEARNRVYMALELKLVESPIAFRNFDTPESHEEAVYAHISLSARQQRLRACLGGKSAIELALSTGVLGALKFQAVDPRLVGAEHYGARACGNIIVHCVPIAQSIELAEEVDGDVVDWALDEITAVERHALNCWDDAPFVARVKSCGAVVRAGFSARIDDKAGMASAIQDASEAVECDPKFAFNPKNDRHQLINNTYTVAGLASKTDPAAAEALADRLDRLIQSQQREGRHVACQQIARVPKWLLKRLRSGNLIPACISRLTCLLPLLWAIIDLGFVAAKTGGGAEF